MGHGRPVLSSAVCWFASATVRVRLFGTTPFGGATRIHDGGTVSVQARWNTAAAAFAAGASLLLAITTAMGPGH